jgi:hypothetical protein
MSISDTEAWYQLLDALKKLQISWEERAAKSQRLREILRARATAAGIEIARNRLAQQIPISRRELEALLAEWTQIGNSERASKAAETVHGIDHGIQLVIDLVRQYLGRERKLPNSAKPDPKSESA